MVLPLWKGIASLNLMLPKEDRQYVQLPTLGGPPPLTWV